MADNENGAGKVAPWTDRDKLVYLFGLIEASNVTLDFKAAPTPAGRTPAACRKIVERLKDSLKDDLAALKAGLPPKPVETNEDGTPKTPKLKATLRKRKAPATPGDEDGTPKPKRGGGRKKKVPETETPVKPEPPVDEGAEPELQSEMV